MLFTDDLPLLVSIVVFPQMAENLMTVAYENGVNLFDTAEVYASGRSDSTFSSKLFLLVEGINNSK